MRTLVFLLISLNVWAVTVEKTVVLANGQEIVVPAHPDAGLSLYVFDPDLGKPVGSVCNGRCAVVWPPFFLSEEQAQGLELPNSFVIRDDGKLQLAINERPVYLYFLDKTPNDILGDGVGGNWHLVK